MILTKKEIIRALKDKRIKINPKPKNIGPASADLSLDKFFRLLKPTNKPIVLREGIDYKKYSQPFATDKYFDLKPGQTILGVTQEKITLAPNIAARLEGRSRYARLGLTVHITAGFMAPGIDNKQVLEITNLGPNTLRLVPGEKICQMIFEECRGEAKYVGKFAKQGRP